MSQLLSKVGCSTPAQVEHELLQISDLPNLELKQQQAIENLRNELGVADLADLDDLAADLSRKGEEIVRQELTQTLQRLAAEKQEHITLLESGEILLRTFFDYAAVEHQARTYTDSLIRAANATEDLATIERAHALMQSEQDVLIERTQHRLLAVASDFLAILTNEEYAGIELDMDALIVLTSANERIEPSSVLTESVVTSVKLANLVTFELPDRPLLIRRADRLGSDAECCAAVLHALRQHQVFIGTIGNDDRVTAGQQIESLAMRA